MRLLALLFLFAASAVWADPTAFTVRHGSRSEVHNAQTKGPKAKRNAPAVDVDGTLEIIHEDDFDKGQSTFRFHVRGADGKVTRLNVDSLPQHVRGGSKVHVHGRRTAQPDQVDPETLDVQAEPLALTSTTTVTALFMAVQFSNQTSPPASAATIQAQADQVHKFYAENSYGREDFAITIAPVPLLLSIPAPTTCDYTGIANAANTAATNAGLALSSFTYKLYIFRGAPCGWRGLAYVNYPKLAWSNGANGVQVYSHEIGHNHGLYHAGSVNCVGAGCSVSEYGDAYDTMGNRTAGHFNARQKSTLQWANVAAYSGGTQQFTLTPIEAAGGAVYGVKVSTPSTSRTYWVEYRQPIGSFDTASGVQIRLGAPFESAHGMDDTQTFPLGALGSVGASYYDAQYGITAKVVSADASSAVVEVSTGSAPPPTTAASPDGTLVPPAISINDGKGCTWTLAKSYAHCNGTAMFGGAVTLLEWKNAKLYAQNVYGVWWVWTGTGVTRTTAP